MVEIHTITLHVYSTTPSHVQRHVGEKVGNNGGCKKCIPYHLLPHTYLNL